MAAAVEPWQAAGARRKRRSAARRPRGGEAAAGRLEAEPEADGRVVLRRIREAEGEETETQSPQICGPSTVYGALHPCQPVVWTEGTEQTQTRPWELGHPPATPGTPAALISGRRQHWSGSGRVHCESCLSHCGALCLGHSIPFPASSSREDLLLSDFWSLALETINGCLTQHLAQLEAPGRALSEALGNLHLDSSPDASDAAPGSVPGDTLVPGSRHLKCVCYGLGNFATCVIARNQLAFLLLFLEKCQIPRRHCWVYDPLFSQLEIAVLDGLGVTVLSENEEGRRCVGGEPTVFYMPHCGTALYNNLLWSNWSAGALSRMLVVGNSFRGLEERLLSRVLHKNYPYVAKVLQGLEERGLPQTPPYADVFNDMSVHWFPAEKLLRLPPDTWAFREEPDYGDCEHLEIIRSRTSGPSAASPTGP